MACACTDAAAPSSSPAQLLPFDAGAGAPAGEPSLERLSGTGLFASGEVSAGLAPGVLELAPRFAQWLDGASARSFLWLPAGTGIDATDDDRWIFPEGTRAWQELARDGRRIETRFMEKRGSGDWLFATYHWQTEDDAMAVERGLSDASGTGHEIPHLVDCGSCHDNVSDRLLGVSAIQLDPAAFPALAQLVASGAQVARVAALELPGTAVARAALGYLHANCGACHNPSSVEYRSVDLELWLSTGELSAVELTPAYRTAVNVPRRGLGAASPLAPLRIAPGAPEGSALYQRMATRDSNMQMPPLGTKQVDAAGTGAVGDWIRALTPP